MLAPLVGLIAEGASLRTAFYFAICFYVCNVVLSMSNRRLLKPGFFEPPKPQPTEAPEQTRLGEQIAASEEVARENVKRVSHGMFYFTLVGLLCLFTFVEGNQGAIAWSCITVLVVSIFLMMPELFSLLGAPAKRRPEASLAARPGATVNDDQNAHHNQTSESPRVELDSRGDIPAVKAGGA